MNFLVLEHKFADDIIAELTNSPLRLFDTDIAILENNIYGVDINEESIEIAKLSLWLRTAKQGRKLSNLSNNIKCGNSLIDDPSVAGDKAFNWQKEFPEVFANGGFDVVIGNPPYVVSKNFNELEKDFFIKNYNSAFYQINLYLLFIEIGIKISKYNSITSYIVPNTWLINQTLKGFREYLIENYTLYEIVDFTKIDVFQDATVLPVIFSINNKKQEKYELLIKILIQNTVTEKNRISKDELILNDYFINYQSSDFEKDVFKKVAHNTLQIGGISKVSFGVKFYQVNKGKPKQTRKTVDEKFFSHKTKLNDTCKMVLEGKDVDKYMINFSDNWIEYGEWLAEPRTKDLFEGERILLRRIVDGTFRATM